jgi:glycosyltransferase involved in cell wall biosynthesis
MKVYLSPNPPVDRPAGGIDRVLEAQARWLPEYGWQVVDNEAEADVVAVHAGSQVKTQKPLIVHNHGLYWTGDFGWDDLYWQYNADVIENLRRADIVTVPSAWVAVPLQRDMKRRPVIIPHGIDLEDWKPAHNRQDNYVLWNKARVDVVADPAPMMELARLTPKVQFVSTFGQPAHNIKIIGPQPFEQMRQLIRNATVYLSTCRETFGIGTLEAMACGVPVLGWDWGGNSDIVVHGETGWLSPPGDYEHLREGLYQCLAHRWEWGEAARERVKRHYQWRDIMAQYAAVYEQAARPHIGPKVSVIIPTYNYADFLPEAIDSVLTQDYDDYEIIVVDDGSTDNTTEVLTRYAGKVRIIRKENGGLPSALNAGYREARGRYCLNLDADNILLPGALRILAEALDADPAIHVAYGHLSIYSEDGNHRYNADWPWENFSWEYQLRHYNQIPSTCMMRREVWTRVGGYRERCTKNEDAEFWCRATSAGFRPRKVTNKPLFAYRWHDANKSKLEGGEDPHDSTYSWTHLHPWIDHPESTPFAAVGKALRGSWPVRSYDAPHISVCIACGPGHEQFLPDALDSLAAQTFREFEVVIANDTGRELDLAAMGHPGHTVVDLPGHSGPAAARNAAIAAARAPLIWILDADDMAEPQALEVMYGAWRQYPDGLVYTDCYTEDWNRRRHLWYAGSWAWKKISRQAIYSVSILFAKQWWAAVGGYPEDDLGWEDWRFGQLLHIAGVKATYVQFPAFIYRHWTGGRCENDYQKKDENLPRCYEWLKRRIAEMGCRGCGGASRNVRPRTNKFSAHTPVTKAAPKAMPTDENDNVLIEFIGERRGAFSVNSRVVRGRKYTFDYGSIIPVHPQDAEWLLKLPDYRAAEVMRPAPTMGPPRPPEVPRFIEPTREEKIKEADATPAAAELARQSGIDLLDVQGTGKNGRITVGDVRKAMEK